MNCKVSCSFGEIVDKVTILKIKKQKVTNQQALFNIQTELQLIEQDNPQLNTKDKLFDILYDTNMKLWDLEDEIRIKSYQKKYDAEYIKCAESIHTTNDLRYKTKQKINVKYNSLIKEEKIYELTENAENDYRKLEYAKVLYTTGEYEKSHEMLKRLIIQYKDYEKCDVFYVDLLFSYCNSCSIFNSKYPFQTKLETIMNKLNLLSISEEQKQWCKVMYVFFCLSEKNYVTSYDYLNQLDIVERNTKLNGNLIHRYNMDFFKDGDKNKTILVYNGGGIGDGYMYARFIPIICQKFPHNNVILISDKRTSWIYKKVFETNSRITIKYYSDEDIPHFDYHCNLVCMIKYLGYNYDTIPFYPLFKNLEVKISPLCHQVLNKIFSWKQESQKTYIFNWKGNPNNGQEMKNRKMELENARSLFELKSINWIIVTQEITNEENKLLDEFDNVKYYGNILDVNETYIDTISIIRNVDGVISTDTSLLHLSANLNVTTYALLTLGCEWRWTHDEPRTNWYPNMKLLRQKEFGKWDNVVLELIDELKSNKV